VGCAVTERFYDRALGKSFHPNPNPVDGSGQKRIDKHIPDFNFGNMCDYGYVLSDTILSEIGRRYSKHLHGSIYA
jgi:hypothetical protein